MNLSFTKGLELAEAFYREAAQPVLAKHYPQLSYSAALIGSGSEVLGYDDPTSTDHHWGPRFQLFLSEEDHARYGKEISVALADHLPYRIRGHSTSFGEADEIGVRVPEQVDSGPVHHMIHIES